MDKIKIIIASVLWGIVGVFAELLLSAGFKTSEVAGLRFLFSALILAIFLLVTNKKLFKVKNLFLCALIGISNFATTMCFYNCIKYSGSGIACVLLFTTPVIVVISNAIFHKKAPSKVTVLGIVLCIIGLMLAGKVFTERISVKGFIFGICSAITNSIVTILGAKAIKKENALTVNFYGFLFSACLGLIFIKPSTISIMTDNVKTLSILILLAGACTVLPYTLYISALKSCSEEKASLLCSSEPIVANILECIIFAQTMLISQVIGLAGIIVAVWLVSIKNKKEGKTIDKQILQGSFDGIR